MYRVLFSHHHHHHPD
ncbi:his operon leader peptide [Martelella alba]|uniref:his operon leader peptide n=1 Tax=Martelella alba TaxID=2590451 RepID=A0ABY2SL58_9HYPH|nr:his operon leader peptide [Martelella alba]TKI05843.1 his operon leader peptide [Martelella alba]